MRREFRFAGFGGQGVISLAVIYGQAASIAEGFHAVQTQSYGPESRGGSCHAEVVVAESEIHSPGVTSSHVLVAMSQESFDRFCTHLHERGLVIYDSTMVVVDAEIREKLQKTGATLIGIDATDPADKMGRTIVANIVMLGALSALEPLVKSESILATVLSTVPAATKDLNKKAFELGIQLAAERKAHN